MKTKIARHLFVVFLLAVGMLELPLGVAMAFPPMSPPSKQKKPPKAPANAKNPEEKGFSTAPDQMTKYAVDTESAKNEITFTSQAPAETIKGKTTKVAGQIELNPRKLDTATGKFAVDWKTVDTGKAAMNQHLMGPPWVNTKDNPQIVFSITGIELPKTLPAKNSKTIKAKFVGTFSMNGKDKMMKIPVTLAYVEPSSGKGAPVKESLGIKANFKVALADFGIEGKGVGTKVAPEQKISVQLSLAKGEGKPEAKPEEKQAKADSDDKKG